MPLWGEKLKPTSDELTIHDEYKTPVETSSVPWLRNSAIVVFLAGTVATLLYKHYADVPMLDVPLPHDAAVPPSPDDVVPPPPQIEVDPNDPDLPKPQFKARVPVVPLVSDDTYETAKLKLGGVDTNGDKVPDGIATQVGGINDPTAEQVAALQNTAGKGLTEGQARLALVDGGYTKGGVTYEIWESKAYPGTFYATPVNASHHLVGNVSTVDTAILTPDTPGSESAAPSSTEALTFKQDFKQTFGYTDVVTDRVVSGEEGLDELLKDQGYPPTQFFLQDTNPWDPRLRQYNEWQIIHDFSVRHGIK